MVSGTSGITSPTICGKNAGQHSKCAFNSAGVNIISTCHGPCLISHLPSGQLTEMTQGPAIHITYVMAKASAGRQGLKIPLVV